jgi:hypothetical protein
LKYSRFWETPIGDPVRSTLRAEAAVQSVKVLSNTRCQIENSRCCIAKPLWQSVGQAELLPISGARRCHPLGGGGAPMFSDGVPKVVTRDRIYHCRYQLIRFCRVTALCFTNIVCYLLLQFKQVRIVGNRRFQLKSCVRPCRFVS